MGRKIGFGFLAFHMGAMAVTFLLIIEKEYAILCVLMALLWGAAAVFFLRMAIGEINTALVRWGWLAAAFLCGNLAAAGIAAGFGEEGGGAQELVLGVVLFLLAYFCLKKARGGSAKLLAKQRSYTPGDPLPVSACPGLFLAPGEVGYLCENVRVGKVKNLVTGSRATRSGASVRITRVISVHRGKGYNTTIRQNVLDADGGTLYVTSKRVVASSVKYSFDIKLNNITAIQPYIDGFMIQISGKNYIVLSDSPNYIMAIINAARGAQ